MKRSFGHATRFAATVGSLALAAGALAASAAAGAPGQAGGNGAAKRECRCAAGFASLDVAAAGLGMTVAQLRAELKAGKTLAQVAAAEGRPVAGLAHSIMGAATTALASAASSGAITQGQAQATLLSLPWQVTRIISRAQLGTLGDTCGLVVLDVSFAAWVLHMRVAELRVELSAGKTLAEIAAARGRPLDAVGRDAVSAAAVSVAGPGTLTEAQATELTAEVTQQIASAVGGLAP